MEENSIIPVGGNKNEVLDNSIKESQIKERDQRKMIQIVGKNVA
jgi:hypothetical protein